MGGSLWLAEQGEEEVLIYWEVLFDLQNKGKKKKSKGKQQLVDITSDDAGKSDSDVAATPEKRPNDASVAAESDEAMEEEVKPQEKKPFDITDMTPCR